MRIDGFKETVLGVVVRDEPWDTQLVWADAQADLSDLTDIERDAAVINLLVELQTDGLVEYFAVTSFSPDDYERDPSPSELLTGDALRDHLTRGEVTLRLRPTEIARSRYSSDGQ
jgi:hypothetical protein